MFGRSALGRLGRLGRLRFLSPPATLEVGLVRKVVADLLEFLVDLLVVLLLGMKRNDEFWRSVSFFVGGGTWDSGPRS